MIALITPTGGRPKQIALCSKWMKRQTYNNPVLWIIVDDCVPITTNCITNTFRNNWEIVKIYPKPTWNNGENTQSRNLQEAVNYLKQRNDISHVFIIEDDDYYKAEYLEKMMLLFNNYELVGESKTIYFNVSECKALPNNNIRHSSLFQTAFIYNILPIFESVLHRKTFIDTQLWRIVKNSYLFDYNLSIGVKGLPGRSGIAMGHKPHIYKNLPFLKNNIFHLKMLFGEDYKYYIND